ncbi:hypothetical protein SPHV1_780009 [Novosphingobium sp. KN65.2]|nr:hypothetical protein SPHV1_780009 [Novosphingobium sp. KN65.2]
MSTQIIATLQLLDMLLPSSMHEQLDSAIGVRVDGFALHEIIAHGKLGFPRKNEWQPNHADYGVDQRGQGHVGDEAALDQCRCIRSRGCMVCLDELFNHPLKPFAARDRLGERDTGMLGAVTDIEPQQESIALFEGEVCWGRDGFDHLLLDQRAMSRTFAAANHVRQMLRARIARSWRAFHVPATVSECGLWELDGPEERQNYVSWPLIFSR